jgi:hypothetical protein
VITLLFRRDFLFFDFIKRKKVKIMEYKSIAEKIIFYPISKQTRFKLMEMANDIYFGGGIKLFQVKDGFSAERIPNGGFLDKPRQATF